MHIKRTIGKVRGIAIRHAKSKDGQELKWAIEAEFTNLALKRRGLIDQSLN